jgi:hypothetical protein
MALVVRSGGIWSQAAGFVLVRLAEMSSVDVKCIQTLLHNVINFLLFIVTCKYNTAINCFTVQHKKVRSVQLCPVTVCYLIHNSRTYTAEHLQ